MSANPGTATPVKLLTEITTIAEGDEIVGEFCTDGSSACLPFLRVGCRTSAFHLIQSASLALSIGAELAVW